MRHTRGFALCLGLLPVVAFALRVSPAEGAPDAGADTRPDCLAPSGDAGPVTPVVVTGGDVPLLTALAIQLALDSTPIRLIQQPQRSCTAIQLLNDKATIADTVDTVYYDKDGKTTLCKLSPTTVDVAFSDSFATTCGIAIKSDVGDFFGPISPQVFVVPTASTQKAISAEAAYVAFGVYNGAASPWIDKKFFFVRDETSGTQQVISSIIGVPANAWWGSKAQGSSKIIPGMIAVDGGDQEKAIGTLPSENAQPALAPYFTRNALRILAFQSKGQIAAFWPDSTVDKSDKANVRDGHYDLWGPLHLFAHVDGAGKASVTSGPVVDRFSGSSLTKQVLDAVSDNFLVPKCAMRVRRTTEGGPISAYTPDQSCGCYYDLRMTGANNCKSCMADADCSPTTPKCNKVCATSDCSGVSGFCEVR